jgi:hypothetical protein
MVPCKVVTDPLSIFVSPKMSFTCYNQWPVPDSNCSALVQPPVYWKGPSIWAFAHPHLESKMPFHLYLTFHWSSGMEEPALEKEQAKESPIQRRAPSPVVQLGSSLTPSRSFPGGWEPGPSSRLLPLQRARAGSEHPGDCAPAWDERRSKSARGRPVAPPRLAPPRPALSSWTTRPASPSRPTRLAHSGSGADAGGGGCSRGSAARAQRSRGPRGRMPALHRPR